MLGCMGMYAWRLIIETAECWPYFTVQTHTGTHVHTQTHSCEDLLAHLNYIHIQTINGHKGSSHLPSPVKRTRSWRNIHESVCAHWHTHTHPLLRYPLSIHNHNMDSVLWATSQQCHIMACSHESPGYNQLQHRPDNRASDWPAGDEAFLWLVSIPGGCVRMCVCVWCSA